MVLGFHKPFNGNFSGKSKYNVSLVRYHATGAFSKRDPDGVLQASGGLI